MAFLGRVAAAADRGQVLPRELARLLVGSNVCNTLQHHIKQRDSLVAHLWHTSTGLEL
jgi:hypothetical protein